MYEIMNVYLENGLKVVLHNVPNAKTVSCGLWVRQGSSYENDNTSGLSHLLEHMIVASKNYGSENNLIDKITSQGIVYNATTTKEFTSYYLSGLSSNIDLCIDILSRLIIDFDEIDDETFENEKKVVEREAIGYYSSFKQIMERSAQALWGNTGTGRIIVGDINNIKSATKEQVKLLYEQRYTPENSCLVIVGGMEYNKTLEIIKKCFGRWEDTNTKRIEEKVNKDPGIYLNVQEGGANSILSICFKVPAFNSPYRHGIEVISLILGDGGVKSRLAKEIRVKRGLAYIINSFENFYENRGILGFTSVCAHDAVNKVAEVMMEQLSRCINEGFTDDEIQGAKNKLITKRILGLENVADHLKFLGKCACYNCNFSLEQEIRNIKKVNSENLKYIAKEVINESNIGLAAIGDIDIDKLLQVIKIN
ncbi:M16 family metallopeptidase [Caloranaerobacter azorensis]|uniref:Insulinase family protein n=1 Tax=Caloranaerobacter azorensis TaxID=116090 RepID=A0A6P1YFX8_9FIRM|nr:pitrilysin family protein [Caloranaerobacter azorensis]QIB28007.1 insulinase family protein [Caloranaerobacter azorensis]